MSNNCTFKPKILITLFIILFAFAGDTVASLIKRYASVKDSGNIMPGHGGLLDRFDSFISVFFLIGVVKFFL